MLWIENLHVSRQGLPILKGVSLQILPGQVHALMGPNGSGKSTLSKVIAGHPDYEITSGSIFFEINGRQKDLQTLSPEERAREGIFLGFQHPVEIPGVSNFEFLRAAFNAVVTHQGGEEMDALDFDDFLQSQIQKLHFPESLSGRQVNVDFSGGEKKRNELLQMAVLSPRLAFLDEMDSGLDVDSLKAVGQGLKLLRTEDKSLVLVTHYNRLLEHVSPDVVHIMKDGRILRTGDASLALDVEACGYDFALQGKDQRESLC